MGTVDEGSPFLALKGNLMELLFKKHVLPEAEAISLLEAAKNGDIRGVCLALNLTMTSADSKDNSVLGRLGKTALVLAAIKNHTEIVHILENAAANLEAEDNNVRHAGSAGADGAVCRDAPHSFWLRAGASPRLHILWSMQMQMSTPRATL